MRQCCIPVMSVAVAAGAAHADILEVPYASLTGDYVETLEAFDAGGGFEGANYDGVMSNGFGLHFGERFNGQMISNGVNQAGFGVHDVVNGAPVAPLALEIGMPNQNLVVGDTSLVGGTGHAVGGLSSVGWPDFDAIGEGAMAILFDVDQFEFGFTVFGDTGPGDLFIEFFDRQGASLGAVAIDEVQDAAYAFRTDSGLSTIAGALLTNNEDEGISFDNFKYHLVPAPETAAIAVCGAVFAIRRRR